MSNKNLTQSRLKQFIHYDENTGIFTWIKSKGSKKSGEHVNPKLNRRYLRIMFDSVEYSMHQLAWLYVYGRLPKDQIDHIDHNPHNNRISNLREVTHKENHKNKKMFRNNSSGIIGVDYHKREGKWRARITLDGYRKFLGWFENKEDAIKARMAANIKYGYHPNHGM